jgi:hypothetical protein
LLPCSDGAGISSSVAEALDARRATTLAAGLALDGLAAFAIRPTPRAGAALAAFRFAVVVFALLVAFAFAFAFAAVAFANFVRFAVFVTFAAFEKFVFAIRLYADCCRRSLSCR